MTVRILYIRLILLATTLAFSNTTLQAQESPALPTSLFEGIPVEEVTLFTDRNIYITGEDIWIQAGCFLSGSDNPSPLSKILYLEIFDARKKVYVKEKFKLENGRVSCAVSLPEEIPTGYYFIRAYTQYLRNFPPESYAQTYLTIVNPELPQPEPEITQDVYVKPEGGYLLANRPARVAAMLSDDMLHQMLDACLVDESGAVLKPVSFFPNGLAMIRFTPVSSNRYYLQINLENNDFVREPLPPVSETAQILQSDFTSGRPIIRIYSAGEKQAKPGRVIILNKHRHVCCDTVLKLPGDSILLVLPESTIAAGNYQAVLMSSDGAVLSTSEFYKNLSLVSGPRIEVVRPTYHPREKAEIQIIWPGKDLPDIRFSRLSVVKKSTSRAPEALLPGFLLRNPFLLNCRTWPPSEYSGSLAEQVKIALILFHQTESGSAVGLPDKNYLPDIRDISLSGKVRDRNTGEAMENIQIFCSILFDDFQFHTARTDNTGNFVFTLNHLYGEHNFYISCHDELGRSPEILINHDFSTDFSAMEDMKLTVEPAGLKLFDELLMNREISKQFPQDILYGMEPITPLSPWISFTESPAINLSEFIALSNFREVINEIVPNVRLKQHNDQYRMTVFNDKSQVVYEDPLILLDNIPVTDINALAEIHPAKIESIRVINQPYVIGDFTIRGLVMINTKTENFAGLPMPEGSAFIEYKGLTPCRYLRSPDYSVPLQADNPIPNYRTVLYCNWLETGYSESTITFYTSDYLSEYDVIYTGITADGMIFQASSSFCVDRE